MDAERPLSFRAFDRGAWRTSARPRPRTGAGLAIATWNVWFDDFWQEERLRAVLAELRAHEPDVIGLQEMLPETLEWLCDDPWVQATYAISDTTGDTLDDYGVVMLSRLPVIEARLVDLPSGMGRRLLVAELAGAGRRLHAATVHLESLESESRRREQLAIVQDVLREEGGDAVVGGDFNFCSAWKSENDRIAGDFVDVWPALHAGDPGYTEDTDVNVMLREKKGERTKKVRFDRVLLRSPRATLRPVAIDRLGTAAISRDAPDVFPSDHFGLVARFEAAPPGNS